MRIAVRPSKTYLWKMLDSDLAKASYDVALDSASADFKNRPSFNTKNYFGMDFNLDSLQKGVLKYPGVVGFLGDLTNFKLPEASVDLIVSTNTLSHLSGAQRLGVIKNFSTLLRNNGMLLLEIDNDSYFEDIHLFLMDTFSEVRVNYYGNYLSRFYEKLWEKDGALGSHTIAGNYFFLLLSKILCRIEDVTSSNSSNSHVYIRCTGRNVQLEEQNLELSNMPQLGERIFEI